MKKIKIGHIITRLIIGGAQENTIFTVEGLRKKGYDVTLISGPALGPEGSLIGETRKKGIRLIIIPELRRAINPFLDTIALVKLIILSSIVIYLLLLTIIEPKIVSSSTSSLSINWYSSSRYSQ